MANYIVQTTGTVPTVPLTDMLQVTDGPPFVTALVLTHPQTETLVADNTTLGTALGFSTEDLRMSLTLQAAITAGEVTLTQDGNLITDTTTVGTGTSVSRTLAETLIAGNTSGANDILMDTTQAIQLGANADQHIKDLNTNQVQLGVNRELLIPIANAIENTVWKFNDAAISAASDTETLAINFPDGQMVWSQDGAIFGIADFKGITASRTWTHPDKPGTYAMTSDIPTKIFEFSEAEAEANTSSTVVWINAVTHATASISPGNYRVTFSYEKDNASNNVITDIRGTINGTEYLFDGAEVRANQWNAHGGSKVVNFSFGGNQTITIDFRSPSGTTAGIRRARLTVESINI